MTAARGRLVPILVTIVPVLAVIPIKFALNAAAGQDIGYIPSMAAIVVAASLGGFLPGIGATAAAIVLEDFFFAPPKGSFAVVADYDRLRLVLLGVVGLLASWLAWLRGQAEAQAQQSMTEATIARDRADLNARRVGALQALATQLAGAATTNQILEAGLDRGVEALRADGAAVYHLEPDGETLVALGWRGYEEAEIEPVRRIRLDAPLAVAEAARVGEPVFIEDRARDGGTVAGRDEAEPGPDVPTGRAATPVAIAAVPLEVEDGRFGTLAFTWDAPHELAPDRRAFVAAMGRLVSGSMERARLLDAERAARERMDLLAEAARVLNASLDYETTLRRLASLALPKLGEVGIVDVFEEGRVRRLVTSARPELDAAAAIIEAHPLDPQRPGPLRTVVESGAPGVFEIDETNIAAAARSPEHAEALRALGLQWGLVTPLRVLNRTTGILAFLRGSDRTFDAGDIEFATELGDRAGRALENARLHTQVEQLAARERERAAELEAVVASIGEGILVADSAGRITSSNAAATRLLGVRVTTTAELRARLLEPEGSQPVVLSPEPSEYRLADRPTAWVEIAAYPVAARIDGATKSSVIVCRDVSAFRQGQALREAFLGLLSHELRTPVTTIYGGSAVLVRPDNSLDAATRDEILSDIAGEADRLYRLVEDLLVLARFDEGIEIGREPALLQRLVPAVVDQEQGRWPAATFAVEAAPDLPAVSGDETSIIQVVRNLLSNAAKYSAGGAVTAVVERADDGVAVRVLDEGSGINPAEAEDLFSPFYRSPTTARMAAGAGIGLYVSRRLVDAMGGRIWAARRPERGSEFGFVLPVYSSADE